jgi:hypothetical protein
VHLTAEDGDPGASAPSPRIQEVGRTIPLHLEFMIAFVFLACGRALGFRVLVLVPLVMLVVALEKHVILTRWILNRSCSLRSYRSPRRDLDALV